MTRIVIYFLTLVAGIITAQAQQTKGKVVDSKTQEPIAYANIKINDADNTVTNTEGFFTISEKDDNAVVTVSFLGYHSTQLTVAQLKNNSTVYLEEGVFELGSVFVSNQKPNADSIMRVVKENLSKNYEYGSDYKYRIFKRETSQFKPKTMEVDITKSTGFTKKQLKETNEEIRKFTSSLIKYPPISYTDILIDYAAVNKKTEDGKSSIRAKANVIKAIRLADESRSTSLDDLEESATKMFLKHMDTTKFYRIKSGWFGSRDTLSFSKEYNDKQKEKRKKEREKKGAITVEIINNLENQKSSVRNMLRQKTAFTVNNELNFIKQTQYYTYTFDGVSFLDDEMVYIIGFKPKKSKGKFQGKLYVSETDFAVVRADYQLAEGKRLSGINLKLILGVKVFEDHSKGTFLYRKNPETEKYYLQYASIEEGQYFYLHRPIKFIELADKDREVVAFDIKVEGNSFDKTEFLNISSEKITEAELEAIKEKDFEYQKLRKYDPSIWKDYNAIEPVEEMKRFQVME
jgi:hypothetical protein